MLTALASRLCSCHSKFQVLSVVTADIVMQETYSLLKYYNISVRQHNLIIYL